MVMCGYLQGAGVEFHRRTAGPLRNVPPSSLPEGGCQTLDANHYRMLGVAECGHRHVGHCQGLCGRNRWRRYFCTYNKSTIEYSCIFFHTNKKKIQLSTWWNVPATLVPFNQNTCASLCDACAPVATYPTAVRTNNFSDWTKYTEPSIIWSDNFL